MLRLGPYNFFCDRDAAGMKTKKIALKSALIASFALGGCATTTSDMSTARIQDNVPPSLPATEKAPRSPVPIDVTPFSTYQDQWANNDPAGKWFADAYTKVTISSDILADKKAEPNSGDQPEALPYKKRSWILRALLGQEFSINLTAKVVVGTFESTFPLATLGHQSNSDGEQWSRIIHHSMSHSPLFLVKSDGSASVPIVKLSVNGTNSYSSRGAATALQTVLGVARATSQPASVVTRLSEQSTKERARAVDDAISKLFGSGITEEHWSDRDLRTWSLPKNNNPRGIRVVFRIPGDEENWNSELFEVGAWTITFDYPRPSIFSDWYVCDTDAFPRCAKTRKEAESKVHGEIDSNEVLNYVLVNGNQGLGTIRAYISQQDWYTSAQANLVNPALAANTAASLCRRIRNEITGLGLNGFDAAIVVWAVTQGMPMPNGAPNFRNIGDCEVSIGSIEKDKV